jgi:effector-binding domain-containing protein
MAHEGPFEELNQATEAFMAALEAQGVERAGPCTRVFHTEPDKGPYAELFVPIHGEREVAEPLKLRIFPEAAYARAHYEGPKAGVRMAHEIMVHQMAERGWRPAGPLMQTIFEAGENHVACMLRFVVAKMEGEPEGEPEHPEMTDEGHIPVKILGPVKVIQPGEVKIEDPDAGQ